MEIKDLQANTGNVELTVKVISKDEPRTFEKFGREGRVCNAKIQDESGEVTLTLWNDDIDKVNVGDTIQIKNGWCSEFRDQKQVSSGKFGSIEVLEKSSEDTANMGHEETQEEEVVMDDQSSQVEGVLTNDPTLLNPDTPLPQPQEDGSGEQQESTPEDNGSEMEEAKLVDDTEDIMVEEEDIMG